MRPGQQHNKRGRGRNRHRSSSGGSGGGGGGGSGGNPLSRVYDSNGPDVKVRGNAQTVAEKYLQLARDAQSSSDHVMAESYFQHAEHYLRLLSEAQGYQQQLQPQFRRPGEEFDDEDGDDGDGEAEDNSSPQVAATGMGEQPDVQGEPPEFENARPPQQNFRQNREFRDNQGNRDGQQQGRVKPRWQDRRDRNQQNGGGENREQNFVPREQRNEDMPQEAPLQANDGDESSPQWEAPSFLRRPAPMAEAEALVQEAVVEKRPRVGRPRKERPVEDAATPETQGD